MTNAQVWQWMQKSITTCQNVHDRASSSEAAQYNKTFSDAQYRFDMCVEEFINRGLKVKDFSPYDYTDHGMENDFFWDGMA